MVHGYYYKETASFIKLWTEDGQQENRDGQLEDIH